MKKKLAIFALAVVLMLTLSVIAFAEEGAATEPGGEAVWNLWSLLNPSNLNIMQLLMVLVSTVATAIRVFGGSGGLKSIFELLGTAIKNLIPHA